jgi:hypothetical protein
MSAAKLLGRELVSSGCAQGFARIARLLERGDEDHRDAAARQVEQVIKSSGTAYVRYLSAAPSGKGLKTCWLIASSPLR